MVYEALSNKHFAFCSKAVKRNQSYNIYNTRGIQKKIIPSTKGGNWIDQGTYQD